MICIICLIPDKGLDKEGIFRVPGNGKEINKLRKKIDQGEDVNLEEAKTHTLANLLKLFFRELPSPLLTYDLFREFMDTRALQPKPEQCIATMKEVVSRIPTMNQKALKYVVDFFSEVSQYQESNKMNAENLAIVFGPNLLSPQYISN